MRVLITISGQHPRSEKTVQATQDWERGRISRKELNSIFKEDVSELIKLQEELMFDFTSDGQMTEKWNDLLRPFTMIPGIKKGPLVRWFNTNTFYYVPVIYKKPINDSKVLINSISKEILKKGNGKIIVPDPLTFAECSENLIGMNKEEIMYLYAQDILNKDLVELQKQGIKYVQFSSPSLTARFRQEKVNRDTLNQLGESIKLALRKTTLRSGFYSYFGDGSNYIPEIYDFIPTNDIGFDLTETDYEKIDGTERCFIAGIVNSRTSYIEREKELLKVVEKLVDKFKELILCPSSDLQYIPRKFADEKLKLISKLRDKINA